MKKPSTIARAMSLKATNPEADMTNKDDLTLSESCPADLAQTLFALKLESSKPVLRRCFRAARIFLEQFESAVLNDLSAGTCLDDYDEITLNRQKRCEHALSEIDLRLCVMMIEARRTASLSKSETEFSLDTEQPVDYPSETH